MKCCISCRRKTSNLRANHLIVQTRTFSNFDPEYCRRAVALSALASVVVLVVEIAIMIFVRSDATQCPGWAIRGRNGSETSLWFLVAVFGGVGAFASCLQYLRWDRLAERIRGDIMAGEMKPSPFVPPVLYRTGRLDPRSFPYNTLTTAVSIAWPLLCTGSPLRIMLTNCTIFSKYFS
jgi:hypothetical protein